MWKQEDRKEDEELAIARELEPHKTWIKVKLPNIPIELSRSVEELSVGRTKPRSRAVETPMDRERGSSRCSRPTSKHMLGRNKGMRRVISPVPISLSLAEQNAQLRTVDVSGELERKRGWEPFSCVCQFCGDKFGKHSVAIHERRCPKRCSKCHLPPSSQQMQKSAELPATRNKTRDFKSHKNYAMQKVATIVTMGLKSGIEKSAIYASLPPRPHTQTLKHSTLRSSGIGLPLASSEKFQATESSVQCDQCKQVVATDRLSIHKQICKPISPTASPFDVVFPNSLRISENAQFEEKTSPKQQGGKPPTRVCYICGREFGSLSIAIHEPQCLTKWHTVNRKLPISERKPVPKRRESKPTIVRALSRENLRGLPDNIYKDEELTERLTQRYFENCYSQFEKDLIPCKRCGRSFAPERHVIHEKNCNAKPIKKV